MDYGVERGPTCRTDNSVVCSSLAAFSGSVAVAVVAAAAGGLPWACVVHVCVHLRTHTRVRGALSKQATSQAGRLEKVLNHTKKGRASERERQGIKPHTQRRRQTGVCARNKVVVVVGPSTPTWGVSRLQRGHFKDKRSENRTRLQNRVIDERVEFYRFSLSLPSPKCSALTSNRKELLHALFVAPPSPKPHAHVHYRVCIAARRDQ